jgi:hypothetical protein
LLQLMLDCKHEVPGCCGAADSNTYFLGSVGQQNVLIACLRPGAPGRNARK